MTNAILLSLTLVLLVATIVQAVQIGGLQSQTLTGAVTAAANPGEETYEQMMARMHPDQVQAPAASAPALPSMVGGCQRDGRRT
ncbi:MAG: hypothetical protein HY369_04010 [Candidatus Aenigmarchaeota archaeon]|nr:hypothetical protein [Candidatus Aenigmarchaeota archaeon]